MHFSPHQVLPSQADASSHLFTHLAALTFHSVSEGLSVQARARVCHVSLRTLAHSLCPPGVTAGCHCAVGRTLVASVSGGPADFKGGVPIPHGGHCLSSGAWGGAELGPRGPRSAEVGWGAGPASLGLPGGSQGPRAAWPAQRLTRPPSVFPSLFPLTSPFVLKCTNAASAAEACCQLGCRR